MKRLDKKKKILLSVVAVGLVAAIGLGIWAVGWGTAEPVGVYPFYNLGMTEYWGDNKESNGPVSSDKIQTVFLSDTQTVTEILVKEGDTVKQGDVLMTFDTTLSGLELERKRLDMEKAKLKLDVAKQELMDIRNMKPMIVPETVRPVEPSQGEEMKAPYTAYVVSEHDGKTQETAFVCWLRDDAGINEILLEELRRKVWGNAGVCEHGSLEAQCEICNPPMCKHGMVESECPVCSPEECEHGNIKALCEICSPILCRHNKVAKDCTLCKAERCEHDNLKNQCNICNPQCIHGENCEICNPKCEHGNDPGTCEICNPPKCEHGNDPAACEICNPTEPETVPTEPAPTETEAAQATPVEASALRAGEASYQILLLSGDAEAPTEPEEPVAGDSYYVVFKVTDGNFQLGGITTWQGVQVTGAGEGFTTQFFNPGFADYSIPEIEPEETEPDGFYYGSGYTQAQILEMRRAKENEIKDLEFNLKVKETDYKIAQAELQDGNVYAAVDGEVLSVLTEDEARNQRQPVIKVSGGGGFYIEGSISELEMARMEIGQEVTVNDWNTGSTYTGTVESIGDFPSGSSYWNGMDNPNTTYYPFTVFVDGSANLQTGAYVSITYSTAAGENGLYLENPFIRTEQDKSYVFVMGSGGKLEKREIVTGKSVYGMYTEVLSGITENDLFAFPYDKNVAPGVPAEERDISELYSW